jgi:hypothetical protein
MAPLEASCHPHSASRATSAASSAASCVADALAWLSRSSAASALSSCGGGKTNAGTSRKIAHHHRAAQHDRTTQHPSGGTGARSPASSTPQARAWPAPPRAPPASAQRHVSPAPRALAALSRPHPHPPRPARLCSAPAAQNKEQNPAGAGRGTAASLAAARRAAAASRSPCGPARALSPPRRAAQPRRAGCGTWRPGPPGELRTKTSSISAAASSRKRASGPGRSPPPPPLSSAAHPPPPPLPAPIARAFANLPPPRAPLTARRLAARARGRVGAAGRFVRTSRVRARGPGGPRGARLPAARRLGPRAPPPPGPARRALASEGRGFDCSPRPPPRSPRLAHAPQRRAGRAGASAGGGLAGASDLARACLFDVAVHFPRHLAGLAGSGGAGWMSWRAGADATGPRGSAEGAARGFVGAKTYPFDTREDVLERPRDLHADRALRRRRGDA